MFSNNQPPNQQSDRSTQRGNRERWHPKEHDAQNLAPEATGKEESAKITNATIQNRGEKRLPRKLPTRPAQPVAFVPLNIGQALTLQAMITAATALIAALT